LITKIRKPKNYHRCHRNLVK